MCMNVQGKPSRRHLALHSDKDSRDCDLCRAVKQRRSAAESGSHPHSEAKLQLVPGAHTFGDNLSCVYFDVLDYGPQAAYQGSARYDLFGYDVASA